MNNNVVLMKQFFGVNYAPVGTLYIADALEQAGFNVTLLDCRHPTNKIIQAIKEKEPIFVGFSVYTIPLIDRVIEISKSVKENTNIPVVWGGVHPTILPQQCLSEDYIDYVVVGEGEEEIIKLANDIKNKKNLNIRLRQSLKFIENLDKYKPAWHLTDLNTHVFSEQYTTDQKNYSEAKHQGIFYYLPTSRGCPFKCGFCYNQIVHKSTWRTHSFEWVKNQINYLCDNVIMDGISLWDDNFFVNKERALKIIKFLKEKKLGFLVEARANLITDETAKILKESGCLQVFVGAESGSPRVLSQIIRKGTTVEQILNAAKIANKYKLNTRFSFMLGLPGETIEEIKMTHALINKLKQFSNVSISGPKIYTPYPGTPLWAEAEKLGFVSPKTTAEWKYINRYTDPQKLPWLWREMEKENLTLKDLLNFRSN